MYLLLPCEKSNPIKTDKKTKNMKRLQLSFFFLILISLTSINSNAQEFKYSDLATTTKSGDYESYLSKDGAVYKIGDRVKIGTPSTNKSFAFIIDEDGTGRYQLNISASGKETAIKKIYVDGNKRTGYSVTLRTKGSTFMSNYMIDIENAIAAGEIKSFGMSSDEALNNLKRAKDKLDLGLISQEEYDSTKIVLKKYIK